MPRPFQSTVQKALIAPADENASIKDMVHSLQPLPLKTGPGEGWRWKLTTCERMDVSFSLVEED